jgi:outer membrane protein OmpA-like peptidoglycan-associated protein
MKGILFCACLLTLLTSGCSTTRYKSTFRLQTQPPLASVERTSETGYAPIQAETNTPETPKIALDAFGRPIPLFLKVSLPYNGAATNFDPKQNARLEKIGQLLVDNPESQALIAGHCENLGNEQLARLSSEQRAQALKQLLVDKYGVASERIQTIAYGNLHPLAANATEAGRQRNRRVEITLTGYYRAVKINRNLAAADQPATLYYNPGETEAASRFLRELDAIGSYLSKHPEAVANIDGYTDSKGSTASNIQISQRRADAVKNYLALRHYIALDRLISSGRGPVKPIASNETDAGRQKNRRVEITLLRNPEAIAAQAPSLAPQAPQAVNEPAAAPARATAQNSFMNPNIDLPKKRTRFVGELSVTERNASLPASTKLPSSVAVRFSGANPIPEESALPALDALGKALQANPQARIVIEARSDKTGNHDMNWTIARQRAEYVRNYLISMYEISPQRISATQTGVNAPLASLGPDLGPTANSQVEVKVTP